MGNLANFEGAGEKSIAEFGPKTAQGSKLSLPQTMFIP